MVKGYFSRFLLFFPLACMVLFFLSECEKEHSVTFEPVPADNATDQELSLELSWSSTHANESGLSWDVFFGEEELELEHSNWPVQNCYIPNLNHGKTYKWKVVAIDGMGNIFESPIWKFTTKADVCALYWQVCDGNGLDNAADYPGNKSIHPIIICGIEINIPEDWRPLSDSETELVACISIGNIVVQQCSYNNGGTFTRYQKKCEINLHEAKTGNKVNSTVLFGGNPSRCPDILNGMSGQNYGSNVTDERIIDWLSQYIEK